jgi:hypothetical protein
MVTMPHIELIPEHNTDDTVVLRPVVLGPLERLRRLLRRLRAA